jgi:uncharacterized protein YjlB
MAGAKAYGVGHARDAPVGTETFVFDDDGLVPNSLLPLIVRRHPLSPAGGDPAASFKAVFARNGWTGAWQNGIFDYHHYHSTAHEVLGVVSGSASVIFGGHEGHVVSLRAGDVVVIPAGVGHSLINATGTLSVVGAYAAGRDVDLIGDDPVLIAAARERIRNVPLPGADPIDGPDGPLVSLWR